MARRNLLVSTNCLVYQVEPTFLFTTDVYTEYTNDLCIQKFCEIERLRDMWVPGAFSTLKGIKCIQLNYVYHLNILSTLNYGRGVRKCARNNQILELFHSSYIKSLFWYILNTAEVY